MTPLQPELSDLIVDIDPWTLERRPVQREAVRAELRRHGMRRAERILDAIPGGALLDGNAVDALLTDAHCELQRLSFEFRNGERLLQLLAPLLTALREACPERPLRVVDVGCGLGFVLRWLAAFGGLGDDVTLDGYDLNPALVSLAQALADEEGLSCRFHHANALETGSEGRPDARSDAGSEADSSTRLEAPSKAAGAHVFLSTGVLHHFRGEALTRFFAGQRGAWALLHCDIKASWTTPLGAWLFHQARMRVPLARHDGVLSAVRAHPRETLLQAARTGAPGLRFALFDGRPSPLPLLRTLQTVVGLREALAAPFRHALGRRASRLEALQ